jgi:hypothetical protein
VYLSSVLRRPPSFENAQYAYSASVDVAPLAAVVAWGALSFFFASFDSPSLSSSSSSSSFGLSAREKSFSSVSIIIIIQIFKHFVVVVVLRF